MPDILAPLSCAKNRNETTDKALYSNLDNGQLKLGKKLGRVGPKHFIQKFATCPSIHTCGRVAKT